MSFKLGALLEGNLGVDLEEILKFRWVLNPFIPFRAHGTFNSSRAPKIPPRNSLEMSAQMGFGPFKSEEKRFKLVDIANQFAVVLSAIPFVSQPSRDKALQAVRAFATKDVPPPPPFAPSPGLSVALHNHRYNEYLNMASDGKVRSSGSRDFEKGLPDDWLSERWTVVDAGQGSFGLHNQET